MRFDDGMMGCLFFLRTHVIIVFRRQKNLPRILGVVFLFIFFVWLCSFGMFFVNIVIAKRVGMGLGECPCFSRMKIMPFQDALLEVNGCSSLTCQRLSS